MSHINIHKAAYMNNYIKVTYAFMIIDLSHQSECEK